MTRKCNACDEELIPDEDWPVNYQEMAKYIHKTCDTERVDSNRHFCTMRKPDGTVDDWIRSAHRLTHGGEMIDDWWQDRPGDKWPKRKELLTGVLAKSNGKPTLKTCNNPECGKTKPITDFNVSNSQRTGAARFYPKCRKCSNTASSIDGHIVQRACNRLGLTGGRNKTDNMTGYYDYPLEQQRAWHAEQKKLDEEAGITEPTEPNKQAEPPKPKPKPMIIPPVVLVMPSVSTTPKWREGPTSKALNHNLWVKHGGCEWTGAPKINCNEAHTLSRKLCKSWDHPEWIWDEENCTYMLAGLNDAMERAGYWLTPCGRFAPPVGEDYAEWVTVLGVPDVRIEMYGKRAWFATMAMKGEIVEQFTGASFSGEAL